MYATGERIWEITGLTTSEIGFNAMLREFMTTTESLSEILKKGFHPGTDDDRWSETETGELHFKLTDEEMAWAEGLSRKMGHSSPVFSALRNLGIVFDVKEAQKDERQHKAKRQE